VERQAVLVCKEKWAPLRSALVCVFLAVVLGPLSVALRAADAPCTTCHEQAQKLEKSAHAGLPCEGCHEGHETYPHPANLPKPVCTGCHADQAGEYALGIHGQARKSGNEAAPDCGVCHGGAHDLLLPKSRAFRAAEPETCGLCHVEEAEQFRASVHGRALANGVSEVPACADCHGEHRILKPTNPASPVSAAHIRDTCGSCHGDVLLTRRFGIPSDRLVSFDASFHGLAAKSGSQTVANCASCHGVHNILPSSDPKSTINPKTLSRTCGKCHPGAGERFAISQVHLIKGKVEAAPLRWVRKFYLVLIPVTLGLMLLHNTGDWIRKLVRLRFGSRGPQAPNPRSRELRMLPFERIQHALLALSFFVLAATGFALKYPDQWWARPLLLFETVGPVRSLIHKVAAVVFMAVAVTHMVSLIASRRLRRHWKEMLPRIEDAREAVEQFAYNVGVRSGPAASAAGRFHSYIQKVEYWAVVWGSAIMASTGLFLWAHNLALEFFPKIVLDVATSIHFYEAVLAAGAIVVWHFYSVIFDPDVYPLDTAFLSGYRASRVASSDEEEATTVTESPAGRNQ
jgi:cytochrome b subunit of formate dehydrogenase